MILGSKRHCHELSTWRDLTFADEIERALDMMSERCNGFEPEHRAGALYRVQRAKGGIDEIAIAGRAFEIEQYMLELLKQFLRLLSEGLRRIGCGHQPSTFLTTVTNCSCWNGLVIQPVAPAALASCFIAASDSVVRKMIGTPL